MSHRTAPLSAPSSDDVDTDATGPPRLLSTGRRGHTTNVKGTPVSSARHRDGRGKYKSPPQRPIFSSSSPPNSGRAIVPTAPQPGSAVEWFEPLPASSRAARRQRRSLGDMVDAEAVRVAREFSMDMYRNLHQRHFRSPNEELDFLRKDFVASRRTLVLLYEENKRLNRELLDRVAELYDMQSKLNEMAAEAQGASSSASCTASVRPASRPATLPSVIATAVATDDAAAVAPDSKEGDTSQPSSSHLPVPVQRTPLSLYAATKSISINENSSSYDHRHPNEHVTSERSNKKKDEVDDVQALVRDLRANLARRDTALDTTTMELAAAQERLRLSDEQLHSAQDAALQAKQHRDDLQRYLTAKEEEQTAQSRQLVDLQSQLEQLQKEKEELQLRLTSAELLNTHAAPAAREVGELSVSGEGSSHDHLREQLQLYRSKWQASEDEVEHLHERLSQLQRQLLRHNSEREAVKAVSPAALSTISPPAAEAGSLAPAADIEKTLAHMRTSHTAELAQRTQQHQDQLLRHADEVQRLQRRLDRSEADAAFREDQLREQRQSDSRQHAEEVQSLQGQLRNTQTELLRAQQDREHLAQQLRRSSDQTATLEVLQDQVAQLKRRLGEVGTELAQTRGRAAETATQVQKEALARVQAEHDAELAQRSMQQSEKVAELAQAELQLVREQLGKQEAAAAFGSMKPATADSDGLPGEGTCGTPSHEGNSRVCVQGESGDADALASELKGYASLMRINTALQRRIEDLEARLFTMNATATPPTYAGAGEGRSAEKAPAVSVEHIHELARLRVELQHALEAQQKFCMEKAEVEADRRQLSIDNAALARAIEVLERELQARQRHDRVPREEVKRAHRHRSSSSRRRSRTPSRTEASLAHTRNRINAVIDAVLRIQAEKASPPPLCEESRLRQRLQTARARDQQAAASGVNVSPPPAAPPLQTIASTPSPIPEVSAVAPPSPSLTPVVESAVKANETNLSVGEGTCVEALEEDVAEMHIDRRWHVHGSLLPPVHSPPLISRSYAGVAR